jgi:hypothetical protein
MLIPVLEAAAPEAVAVPIAIPVVEVMSMWL